MTTALAADRGVAHAPRPSMDEARRIADEIAAVHADEVDRDARFPVEAVTALREAGFLSAWLPRDLGGSDATLAETAQVIRILGRACSATAMVLAMHQSQIGCLRRHADTDALRALTRRVGEEGLLLASATTEVGIGGDVRRSTCAVEDRGNGTFRLVKQAPVISYADAADVILVTARRGPESPDNDQVLVVCDKADLTLEQTREWNTLGMRGTCSPGFLLTADATVEHILPVDYADISARTMLPVVHTLWAASWLGIAEGAADKARRFVRDAARRTPGVTPPGALRLAELDTELSTFRARVAWAADRVDAEESTDRQDASIGRAVEDNLLKVYASRAVVDVVTRALLIVGIAGYSLDSPLSLGRALRDSHGAALMVNNDRILGNTAGMELVYRGGTA